MRDLIWLILIFGGFFAFLFAEAQRNYGVRDEIAVVKETSPSLVTDYSFRYAVDDGYGGHVYLYSNDTLTIGDTIVLCKK